LAYKLGKRVQFDGLDLKQTLEAMGLTFLLAFLNSPMHNASAIALRWAKRTSWNGKGFVER